MPDDWHECDTTSSPLGFRELEIDAEFVSVLNYVRCHEDEWGLEVG